MSLTNLQELSDEGLLALLGCAPGAAFDEARRAYRELARECHPDMRVLHDLPDTLRGRMERQFVEITAAFEEIKRRRKF